MSRSAERIYDEYLAASARAGDRKSFAALFERWQPKLLAHAYRLMGERELALDVAQEAWADIAKGLARLDDVRVFPAWAYRIVTRRAADAIRKIQRDRRIQTAYAEEFDPTENNMAQTEAQADRSALNKAMNNLSPEQKATVALFYLEDFSVAEIAAALNIPAGTVKTRLMHARQNLRRALEGETKNG